MPNVLLEIGCEEIPARFMPGFLKDLKTKAEEKLKRERVTFERIETLGTCRRLALYIENISARQQDLSGEVKGPPAEFAFDAEGKPTAAANGFAKSQGVDVSKLVVKPSGPKNYVFAVVVKKGKAAEKVLQEIFPEIISSLYLPLSMRWGDTDFKFIRPIHSILALYGNKVIKFELAGIKSGNKIRPHRYVGTGLVPVRGQPQELSLHFYKKFMLKNGVIVDQNERKEMIRKQVQAVAEGKGLRVLIDEDLLNEVNFLVEFPKTYAGRFKEEFLEVPPEVLITSMKKNQKYFPLVNDKGGLQARFAVVTDGCTNPKVVEGNEKVLSARLADARFFFEEDKKQPLRLRVTDLEKVAFFEKLGTVSHKVERMGKLVEWIGKRIGLTEEGIANSRRIAELSKADLTTRMVYEFPELQGVMGKIYALLSDEDPRVAQGILEHYLPRFAEDILPESREGMAVALADRVDSVMGAFSVGSIPSGSEDPYGIRRAVMGIIRIILDKKLDLLLDETLEHSYKLYEPVFLGYLFGKGETGYQDFPRIKQEIMSFIAVRLRPLLLEAGIRYDVADAALQDFNDISDVKEKARAINSLLREDWLAGVVASAERVSRIAANAEHDRVQQHDFADREEKELYDLYIKINWQVGERVKEGRWEEAARELSKLTDPIESFFDKVLVMHQDERVRSNRLALLKSLEKLYLSVADFRKIVIAGKK